MNRLLVLSREPWLLKWMEAWGDKIGWSVKIVECDEETDLSQVVHQDNPNAVVVQASDEEMIRPAISVLHQQIEIPVIVITDYPDRLESVPVKASEGYVINTEAKGWSAILTEILNRYHDYEESPPTEPNFFSRIDLFFFELAQWGLLRPLYALMKVFLTVVIMNHWGLLAGMVWFFADPVLTVIVGFLTNYKTHGGTIQALLIVHVLLFAIGCLAVLQNDSLLWSVFVCLVSGMIMIGYWKHFAQILTRSRKRRDWTMIRLNSWPAI